MGHGDSIEGSSKGVSRHSRQAIIHRLLLLHLGFFLVASLSGKIALAQTQQELISNPGFEQGISPWVLSGNFTIGALSYPHGGSYYAYITGNNQAGTMYQQFSIPANTTAVTLSYYYNITSAETQNSPFDVLNITLQNTSGQYLATVAIYDNRNKGTAGSYVYATYNLINYRGQTVRLNFLGTTNATNSTTFRIDDVHIVATISNVTLTLYVHEGSVSGPVLQGVRVTGQDGGGNSFDQTTNASGYVVITGVPGTWQFTASKSGYQTNSWSQSITVTQTSDASLTRVNQPPTCSLSANPRSGNAPLPVVFTLSASDPDGVISAWVLDVTGDGQADYSGAGLPPGTVNHTYTVSGQYVAAIAVSDNNGAQAWDTETVNVGQNQPPTCSLSADPRSGSAPLTVTFTMNASDPDGIISNWELDVDFDGRRDYFGSGNPPSTLNHTYTIARTYTAVLIVNDNNNASAIDQETINVSSANVTLTLYVHEGSVSGPVLQGVRVTGQDGGGNSFDQTTNASGYVLITGLPGTWQFVASKTGYQSNSWPQDVTVSVTRHAILYLGGAGTLPAAPSNLMATAISATQINLSWDDNSNNEDGFKVERKTGSSGSWSQIATLAGTTIYQNTGLLPNTLYYYRVRAYNGIGNSAYSNEVSKTTLSPQCNITLYNDLPRFGSPRVVSSVCADGTPSTLVVLSIDTSLDPNGIAMRIVEGESGSLQITSRRTGRVEARYMAPDSFCRSDKPADLDEMTRTVNIRVSYQTTQYGPDHPFGLYRPPVLLLHGLWGDSSGWDTMIKHLRDTRRLYPSCLLYPHDYHETNADSFDTNKNVCSAAIDKALTTARYQGYSAGKVDIIAHSMGGILVRYYLRDLGTPHYRNDVHKFVSLDTPHAGSQGANYILAHWGLRYTLNASWKYSANKGAVRDLCVDSSAIRQTLNGSPDANRVPTHAIVGTAEVTEGSVPERFLCWFISVEQAGAGAALILYSIPQRLFREANDLVVALSSQGGGLAAKAVTPYSGLSHLNSTKSNYVFTMIESLLNVSPASGSFSSAGFDPPTLTYNPQLRLFPPLPAEPRLSGTGTVRIISPTSGTLASAGTTVTVQVSVSGATTGVLVASPSAIAFKTTSPFTFNIGVPSDVLGAYPIVAVGFGATDVTATHTVHLKVTTAATLVRLETLPADTLYTDKGQTSSLSVMGEFSDGLKRNLTSGHLGTRYTITNRAIATLAGDGIVRGVAPGTTTLTISNGTVLLTVSVAILPSSSLTTDARPVWRLYR